jgi:acyl-CoA synthetase (AMP-forming)/AMP-acid ligase II
MNVPLTPLDFLERARRLFGPLGAVVDGERRFTYADLAERAHRLAHALRDELGCRPGDRVAYLCDNTVEMLEAYYGVVLAGCVLTPLNVRMAAPELAFVLDDCEAALLVVHPAFAALAGALPARARLDVGPDYEAALAAAPAARFDAGPIDEDAVCELFYTSGSTGEPKGAMLTHRALATHAVDSALTMGGNHRDVVLHTIPLFHVNGWGTPHWVTVLGGRHVMLERFDPGEVLRLIAVERVTRLHLVPTMVTALLESPARAHHDSSSLVQVTVGGAAAGPELLAALEDALGCEVISGYGLTEASPQLTKANTTRGHDALPLDERRRRRATTGHPNIGVDLRVLDDRDREVPGDGATVGEVCVRSNHVMVGYWRRPDETAEALRGGWLRTGDLATVDAEGYVTIVDRRKDIIVSGGENISSVQVEKALAAHPAVLEAAVVALRDAKWGEVPRAYVVVRRGASVREQELIEWVRGRLAHFKAPKRIDFLPELPKSGTGKILKTALRERGQS